MPIYMENYYNTHYSVDLINLYVLGYKSINTIVFVFELIINTIVIKSSERR